MRTDDECYTGTGPAGEVVGQVGAACSPSYSELLAQRDDLAELSKRYMRLFEGGMCGGKTAAGLYVDCLAALSRIKGA